MILESEIKGKEGSQSSNYSSATCQIKSKYLGNWDRRSLRISLEDNLLEVITEGSGKKKSYQLDRIHLVEDADDRLVDLEVPTGRKYQIRADNSVKRALNEIEYYQMYKKIEPTVRELQTPHPKKLNYFATVRSLSYIEDYIPEHRSSLIIPIKKEKVYQRCDSFVKGQDWQVDDKKGGLVFINTQKKSIISKMISYVVKRVLSTGSFMGISFPTFAMKPQTILQTYCKCLGTAPLILDHISNDPLQRMKAFNTVILTLSLLFNDIEKPFNPCIGQTFQGQIGGYQIYAQQISHHPPVTSFFLDGKNYALHGSLELNANLGLNSAVGMFYGQVVVEFDDGGVIKGRMLSGALSGMIIGQTKFGPEGAVYSYDRMNQLVCTYEVKEKDVLTGFIGKLKPKSYQKFLTIVDGKGKQKYQKFKAYKESEFEKVLSRIQAVWTRRVSYDGQVYFDYQNPNNLPFKLTQNIEGSGQRLLDSDSTYRTDVKLRAEMKIEQSQVEKQKIEDQERRLRRLREKTAGMGQRNSIE